MIRKLSRKQVLKDFLYSPNALTSDYCVQVSHFRNYMPDQKRLKSIINHNALERGRETPMFIVHFIYNLLRAVFEGRMFWSLFVKESQLDSALEGIVFKEGKGTFIKHFWKKRLLAYDEVAKCLRYYTPQRVLKGTIYLSDILFITPGRSSGKDARKDSVFEITIPGRIYVFHVNTTRETKKWIGILSRELDSLKIRDRIQLSNGNFNEGTYSKALRPNSVLLNSLKIGDHREHEECCFLFDEEHQHKLIALESLCSLQAMKIYELSKEVQLIQQKCSVLETPPSEEITSLREENKKLRFSYKREQIRVLDLRAKVEEAEEKKTKEQDKQLVQKVEKHQHVDFVKVLHIERGEASTNQRKPMSQASKGNIANVSFVNLPNSASSRIEEIKKLTEELTQTRALLAKERSRFLENAQHHQPVNFSTSPTSSPSPFLLDRGTATTPNPSGSPTLPPRAFSLGKIHTLHESESSAINSNKSSNSYYTFTPSMLTNAYMNHHVSSLPTKDPLIQQLSSHPPSPQIKTQLSSPQLTTVHRSDPHMTNPPQPSKLPHTPLQLEGLPSPTPDAKPAAATSSSGSSKGPTNTNDSPNGANDSKIFSDFNMKSAKASTTSSNGKTTRSLSSSSSINPRSKDSLEIEQSTFNMVSPSNGSPPQLSSMPVTTKPRSHSAASITTPFKPVALHPNGKVEDTTVPDSHPRSRTNSNPPPYKHSLSSSSVSSVGSSTVDTIFLTKFGTEIADMLSSRFPDDNGVAMQFIGKLNDMMTEVSKLSNQLRVEQEKVRNLLEEKSHMLDDMEDMKKEMSRNQRFKNEMEDLMEEREGKLNSMQQAIETERQLRMAAESKLHRLASAQAALQQSILEDEIPPKTEILQPLLTNYSH